MHKHASQSTTLGGFYASNGNDGKGGSRAVTDYEYKPWWEVDLGMEMQIDHIIFRGHEGSIGNSFYNQMVVERRVSLTDAWETYKDLGDLKTAVVKFFCDEKSKRVRYLRAVANNNAHLHVNEFEVYVLQ